MKNIVPTFEEFINEGYHVTSIEWSSENMWLVHMNSGQSVSTVTIDKKKKILDIDGTIGTAEVNKLLKKEKLPKGEGNNTGTFR